MDEVFGSTLDFCKLFAGQRTSDLRIVSVRGAYNEHTSPSTYLLLGGAEIGSRERPPRNRDTSLERLATRFETKVGSVLYRMCVVNALVTRNALQSKGYCLNVASIRPPQAGRVPPTTRRKLRANGAGVCYPGGRTPNGKTLQEAARESQKCRVHRRAHRMANLDLGAATG
jgi:hypothetical protein